MSAQPRGKKDPKINESFLLNKTGLQPDYLKNARLNNARFNPPSGLSD